MKQFFSQIASSLSEIKSRIAFYPTILAFGGFIFALLMKVVENTGISQKMKENPLFPKIFPIPPNGTGIPQSQRATFKIY